MLLSSREFTILKVLFDKAPLSMSELAKLVDVSLRTLHIDVEMINTQVSNQSLKVFIEKHKNNYRWNIQSEKDYIYLKEHFLRKIEYQFPWNLENNRIALIIRKLLITNEYIKSDTFQEKFNISDTTLTKDLNWVRKILNYYSLKLDYKPYYGMKVMGNQYTKLCAYADLHDIYILSDSYLFTVNSYQELELEPKFFNEIAHSLSAYCYHQKYHLNDRALLNLTVFCFSFCKLHNIECTYEKILEEIKKQDSLISTFFNLSIDLEINESEKNYNIIKLLENIKNEVGVDLFRNIKIVNYLANLDDRLRIMSKTGHFKFGYEATEIKLMNYLNVSNSLAFIIYTSLINHRPQAFMLDVFAKLSLFLYNEFFTIPNNYHRLKILIVNPISKIINETFIYRSDLDLSDIDFIYVYEHELKNLDYSNYDAIISLENASLNKEEVSIPVFNFDFFVKQKEYRRFWDKLLIKHQHKIFEPLSFQSPSESIHIHDYSKEDLINEMEDLSLQKQVYKNNYKNWLKLQNIIIKEDQKKYLIILSNVTEAKEIYLENQRYLLIKVKLTKNLLSIKQAETRIRPYIS